MSPQITVEGVGLGQSGHVEQKIVGRLRRRRGIERNNTRRHHVRIVCVLLSFTHHARYALLLQSRGIDLLIAQKTSDVRQYPSCDSMDMFDGTGLQIGLYSRPDLRAWDEELVH